MVFKIWLVLTTLTILGYIYLGYLLLKMHKEEKDEKRRSAKEDEMLEDMLMKLLKGK